MTREAEVVAFLFGLFVAMVLFLQLGRVFGRRQVARELKDADAGLGPLEGAIFGLLGLLLAFTFAGAAARFDARRAQIVQEANAIGTAYLRLDLLPPASQPPLREAFRKYTDARLEVHRLLKDAEANKTEVARVNALQGDIWRQAVAASRDAEGSASARLLLPALNEMFDITVVRTVATRTHAPFIIFVMLAALALVCSFLAGAANARTASIGFREALAFPLIFAFTFYVILDLEYPRWGVIRIDAVDQTIVDVRESMK